VRSRAQWPASVPLSVVRQLSDERGQGGEPQRSGEQASSEETERGVGVVIGTRPLFAMETVALNRGLYAWGVFTASLASGSSKTGQRSRELLMDRLWRGHRLLWRTESDVKD